MQGQGRGGLEDEVQAPSKTMNLSPGRNMDDEERRPEETVGGTTEGRPDETTPTYSRTHTHIHYYVHVHTFYSLSDTLSRSTSYSTVTTSDIYHVTRSFY